MKLPSILRQGRSSAGKSGAGFTLIEMIVAMAILISIMSLGLFLSLDYYKSYIFYNEKNTAISLLYKARSQSLANIDQAKHGVRFTANQYILFEEGGANNISFERSQAVDPFNPPSDMSEVVFDQLTGNANDNSGNPCTEANCSLTLKLGTHLLTISINNEGRIYQK